jgi:hypothetical protein
LKSGGSSRGTAKALALEVWLGPMEGESFSAAAEGGSALIRVGRRRADEKRGLKNDLVLAEGDGVSGFHAELRLSGGTIRLKDLNSTNGTFVVTKRVSGEVEVEPGEIFMLSTTALQAFLEELPSPPVPSDAEIAAVPAFAKILAGVLGSARRHRDAFVDTRHLLDALARSKNAAVVKALESAGTSPEAALDALWDGGLFSGEREWMRRFLAAPVDAAAAAPAPGGEPPLSVRVRAIFGAARKRLPGSSAAEAETLAPGALLTALLQSGRGPVVEWLAEQGVEPVALPSERRPTARKTSRVEKVTEAIASAGERTQRTGPGDATSRRPGREEPPEEAAPTTAVPRLSDQVLAGPHASAAMPVFTTGDVVLDQRARAIATELEEAAAVYRFSTAEDRRSVLKAIVNKALASVAPANRTRILSQIRLQFPIADVPAPPPAAQEVGKLQSRIRELERQIEELRAESAPKPGKRAAAAGPIDWAAILSEEPPEGKHADAGLRVLRELVAGARRTERFLLGVIQGVTMPGSETASFKLPAHRYTLGAIFSLLEQGKEPDGKGVAEYLRDLERWQVAILAGHHDGARLWFEKFWKKVAPSAIEGSAAKSGGWKLGGGAAELWNRYKDAVEGLSPDVVQDQVLKAAYRLAQEEYDRMTKGRSS